MAYINQFAKLFKHKRNQIYVALEDVEDAEFIWSEKEIAKFEILWEKDMPLVDISKQLGCTETSVFLLAFDRGLKGTIKPRKGWHIW